MPDNDKNPVVGIDLGTTFSAIARWDGRGARHYQILGKDTIQSVVYLNPTNGEVLVGQLAYNRGLISPENMVVGVKREMDNGGNSLQVGGRAFTPIELSSKILQYIYGGVRDQFPTGQFSHRGAVVTVPYYFKANQCANTRLAAESAGLNCIGILQEPIAAALHYVWELVQEQPEREGKERILVFDLGGGTFDLTLFDLTQTRDKITFDVLASGGDDRLGGMDFDDRLVALLCQKGNINLEGHSQDVVRKATRKLTEAAIDAKITLSSATSTSAAAADVLPGVSLDVDVTRAEFEECIADYVNKVKQIMDDLWPKARVTAGSVNRVIRVGGSSQIPCMRAMLDDTIGAQKNWGNLNPALCVAQGAAMYAAYLDDREAFGREIEIKAVNPHSLGVGLAGGRFHSIIKENRKVPCTQPMRFTNVRDNDTTLEISVYQGSSANVSGNTCVGTIVIPDLPSRPAGTLDILVTFQMDAEQTLSVTVETEGIIKNAAFAVA